MVCRDELGVFCKKEERAFHRGDRFRGVESAHCRYIGMFVECWQAADIFVNEGS